MTMTPAHGFETLAIHAGARPDPTTGARATPIYQTTSYVFNDAAHAADLFGLRAVGNIYSRLTNPTVSVLEARLAALEGGVGATCAASGHAAQLLVFFALMAPGDHFVASNKLYGGSMTQFGHSFKKFGWAVSFVDPDEPETWRGAVTPNTKAFFAESLANPGGVVTDIAAIAAVAHGVGVPLIIDNTMATPFLCQPLRWGADIVVHSTTKFLSGNGTSMGGVVIDSGKFDWKASGRYPSLTAPDPAYHGLVFADAFGELALTIHGHAVGLRDLGPTMAPLNAFLTLSGAETLALRMQRHCATALEVARFLEAHPAVAWVSYAGLDSSRYHALAKRYLQHGFGSVFTFGLKGGYEAGVKLVESVALFSHLANIGDVRSLIIHPASTTHSQLAEAERAIAGAGADVVRVSIGLETPADIIADLDQALHAAHRHAGADR